MHHQQREDTESRNHLHPGKHQLSVHDVGQVTEQNPAADADHSH
jgi:hypothetical protein